MNYKCESNYTLVKVRKSPAPIKFGRKTKRQIYGSHLNVRQAHFLIRFNQGMFLNPAQINSRDQDKQQKVGHLQEGIM